MIETERRRLVQMKKPINSTTPVMGAAIHHFFEGVAGVDIVPLQ